MKYWNEESGRYVDPMKEYEARKAKKPPLGKIKLLHQASEEKGHCIYCGKTRDSWKPMEECPGRQ